MEKKTERLSEENLAKFGDEVKKIVDNVPVIDEFVPAHLRCRSGLSEGIGKALDVTMGLLIQALDGPAARPVVALA